MRNILFSLVLLSSSASVSAAVEDTTELNPIIVTATRTAQTADETLASVTVVTREEIERRQARSVPDALRGIPGLAIANSGGRGQPTSFFLRGSNADHVLVLIDGVKVGSATLGLTPFQDLPIDQVERIEVVRGPRSSLYGSEAIGGVIQIFTRKGGGPLRPRLTVGGGTYKTVNASLGLSGGGDNGWFDASVRFEDTEGFNACNGEPFVGGCFTIEPDKDGYRNVAGNARAGYRFGDFGEVDITWLRSENDTEFDGTLFSGNESKSVQQVLGGKASLFPVENWNLILSAGRSWDESDIFFNGDFLDRFETKRDTLSWQNDLYLGDDHILTAGIDYEDDRVDGTVDYTVDSRSDTGIFGQYQGGFGGHEVKASLRQDDNEQFGSHTTGDAAWGYSLENGLRLTASYGTAFRAPTFNQLYFPFFGNADLDPEQSRSAELGISGTLDIGRWSLNIYQTDIDDLIAFDAFAQSAANINTARIRGAEAVGTARIAGWDLNANLTLLDPQNRSSGPDKGNLLPRRPQQTFRLDLDRGFGKIRAGGTLFVSGRRYDDLANNVRLDGFALVDLRAEYDFSTSLRLQGRIENLFDEDYETAAYYNQAGRSFYLTLRYTP
ncbi:MAG: TonB-dependent vitamin B12 receptor [Pseudomonadota bacterium]|nr:TonB-dependent vitamin B12 receptor [Pseudomonadota bacterium]